MINFLMENVFYVLFSILICCFQKSVAECDSDGIYTYGSNCQYMCHCTRGEACNVTTGYCENGCDKNWYGQGCQLRDLVKGASSSWHLDNMKSAHYASKAIDEDINTCSYTNNETASREVSPWWRVCFPQNETIWSMEFVTTEKALPYFKGFKVMVETIPISKYTDSTYYPAEQQLCYQHSNSVPSNKTIHVSCVKPLKGNQVRIQLARKDTQLVLCDVRINGGRNMAFKKNVTSSVVENNYTAANAVDGVVGDNTWDNCLVTPVSPDTDWIIVDLGHQTFVSSVKIISFKASFYNKYKLYVSNVYGLSNATIIHDDTQNNVPTQYISLNVTGQYLYFKRNSSTRTVICEIEVYGECGDFQWGSDCSRQCGKCKNSEPCNVENGFCPNGCADGYEIEPMCEHACPGGTFGENCTERCNGTCADGKACRNTDGYCVDGCIPGYSGDKCDSTCPGGTFGKNCTEKCNGTCVDGKACRNTDGYCVDGCIPGYTGDKCDSKCGDFHWGSDCSRQCGKCNNSEPCNVENGICPNGCADGYEIEPMCEHACPRGTFGENCTEKCNGTCVDGKACRHTDGYCVDGCIPGYTGDKCDSKCPVGKYVLHCASVCSANCKIPNECRNVDDHCDGCKAGTQGAFCDKALPLKYSFPVGEVIGGVITSAVVIAVVALVLLFIRRRNKQKEKLSANIEAVHSAIEHDQAMKKERHKRENVYTNSDDLQIELKHSRDLDVQSKQTTSEISTVNEQLEDDNIDVYYNEEPLPRHKTEHSVFIKDLKAYVKKKLTGNNSFSKEFEMLPLGLQHPTTVAKKAENISKNRYKALYAYDHSRVVLKCLPGVPRSDYINASYIKGYNKDIAYIASQGPIENNIDDFWRMIWEKDVHTIVMATRIVEETKMKCKQYWAEVGDTVQYGPICIHTESEDVNAEFQIRRLKVSKEDEPGTERYITHFHYMAWPDKDVPRSTSSFLNFWYQVRKCDEMKTHTWLVHCSAGVGRTGTFIAIDFLYDQGTDQGGIDVFQCVHDLRDQRVCMVQTEEQYRYLYSVLIEAFLLPWKPVHADNIPRVYRQLQEIDQKTGKTNILLEYESSFAETDGGNDPDQDDEMYTSAKHIENRNKNRYDNILAPNAYRPFLFTQVEGCTNYINAIYMPSYRDIYGYILTQTPLLHTAIDCCRLVFEQEVSVIITFEEDIDSNDETGIYLPDNGTMQIGPFTVALLSTEDKDLMTFKRYKLEFESKEHIFTQLVCKQWPSKELTPIDPNAMLTFLQELERLQMKAGRKPVLAQCLNGAERSGLIVVLLNILERVRLANEVSVPHVIRQLRIRRQHIIPNCEQYKFCYEMLQSYVDNNSVYANV